MEASWWEKLTVGKLRLVLMGGAMIIKSLIQFSLMGGAVFSPCCLARGQIMVGVMTTSFKKTCAPRTVVFHAPDTAACHYQSMPLLEPPRYIQASLAQSHVGTLLLSPGSWCAEGFTCALQESVSPVLWKFCNQIPLASKVKFPGASQSLCQIPKLGNLLQVLELS